MTTNIGGSFRPETSSRDANSIRDADTIRQVEPIAVRFVGRWLLYQDLTAKG